MDKLIIIPTLLVGMIFGGVITDIAIKPETKTITKKVPAKIEPYVNHNACKDHGGFLVYKDKAWGAVFVRGGTNEMLCKDGSVVETPQRHLEQLRWESGNQP
jgi:hypothetical protein